MSNELREILGENAKHLSLPSGIDPDDIEDDEWAQGHDETEDFDELDEEKIDRLLELLADPGADESDAELILGALRDHADALSPHLGEIYARFPNIAKQLHSLVADVKDKEYICEQLSVLVGSATYLIEYQLFWLAVIAEDHLSDTGSYGKLLIGIYDRSANHKVAMAKVLEIPTQDFGFKQIRKEVLASGSSDWPSWAAAMGTRTLAKAERNQQLKYFGRASAINHVIANCVMALS